MNDLKKGTLFRTMVPALLLLLITISNGESVKSFDELQIEYLEAKQRIEKKEKKEKEERSELFAGYAGAVQRLLENFQNQSDFENALKAKREVNLAAEMDPWKDTFPGIDDLRAKLAKAIAAKVSARTGSIKRLQEAYLRLLTALRTRSTKAGNLEQALQIDGEIKEIGEDPLSARHSPNSSKEIVVGEEENCTATPQLTVTKKGEVNGDFSQAEGPIGIGPARGSVVTVERFVGIQE